MSDPSLLPANATDQERALALASGQRITQIPVPLRAIWSADDCPPEHLAWLAWAFGVDEWDQAWPDEFKRRSIREAVQVQRRKGSVWSVKRVLANAGYGEAELVEGVYGQVYDGSTTHNGFTHYGASNEWATYRAILERPISNAQAAQVRRLLQTTAPARCELIEFVFVEASNTYNGAIYYDGAFNHGTA